VCARARVRVCVCVNNNLKLLKIFTHTYNQTMRKLGEIGVSCYRELWDWLSKNL